MCLLPALTAGELRRRLHYDPSSGSFLFLWDPLGRPQWNARCAGKPALISQNTNGYRYGVVGGQRVYAHRAAFAWMTGRWPLEVDHINHKPQDNRWSNLRETTSMENKKNLRRRRDNTSGTTGVYWDQSKRLWVAQVTLEGVTRALGRFPQKESAVAARRLAEARLGFHPNHGRL